MQDEPAEVKRRAVETVEAAEASTLAGAVKRIKQEEVRDQAIAEATNTAAVLNLRAAPIGELEAGVGPGSVDIIATDAASRDSVEGGVYGDLGRDVVRFLCSRSQKLPEVRPQSATPHWSRGHSNTTTAARNSIRCAARIGMVPVVVVASVVFDYRVGSG